MPVEFGDLPADRGRAVSNEWGEIAAELRARPGEWARIYVGSSKDNGRKAHTMATNIRRGILASFRPGESFEAHSRGGDVWARYVGSDK